MKKVVCPEPCGHVMLAEDEATLLEIAVDHARTVHPEMAQGRDDDELRDMARPLIEDSQ